MAAFLSLYSSTSLLQRSLKIIDWTGLIELNTFCFLQKLLLFSCGHKRVKLKSTQSTQSG